MDIQSKLGSSLDDLIKKQVSNKKPNAKAKTKGARGKKVCWVLGVFSVSSCGGL